MNLPSVSFSPIASPQTTRLATLPTLTAQAETSHPALEDVVNFTGLAGTTAAVSAATSALVPAGTGFGHVVGVLGVGALAVVGGGILGGIAGEAISKHAEKIAHTSHSADERLGNSIAGMMLGGIGGGGAALATGLLGASPITTAVVAGGAVVALGIAVAVKSAFDKN